MTNQHKKFNLENESFFKKIIHFFKSKLFKSNNSKIEKKKSNMTDDIYPMW